MKLLLRKPAVAQPIELEIAEVLGIEPAKIHYLDLQGVHGTVLESDVLQIDPAPTETLRVLGTMPALPV